jgi:hypothetical protein
MTLAQVCEHSLAQLELLSRANRRTFGLEGMRNLNTQTAAAAAVTSKQGQAMHRKLSDRLKSLWQP